MGRGIPPKALAPLSTDTGGRNAAGADLDGAVEVNGSPVFVIHRRLEGLTPTGPGDSQYLVEDSPISFRIINAWYVMNETVSGSQTWGLFNHMSQHVADYATGAADKTIIRAAGFPPTEAAGVSAPGNEAYNPDLRVIHKGGKLALSFSSDAHEVNMDCYLLCCRI